MLVVFFNYFYCKSDPGLIPSCLPSKDGCSPKGAHEVTPFREVLEPRPRDLGKNENCIKLRVLSPVLEERAGVQVS